MYKTKLYADNGSFAVVARASNIRDALANHRAWVKEAYRRGLTGENVITNNPAGIIYGYGDDLRHFRKNKGCRFDLQYRAAGSVV
jgi:hypothetical protein